MVCYPAGSRKRGVRLLSLIVVLGFSTMWLGSCGGSSSSNVQTNPGTPTGTYTVTINASTVGSVPIANFHDVSAQRAVTEVCTTRQVL